VEGRSVARVDGQGCQRLALEHFDGNQTFRAFSGEWAVYGPAWALFDRDDPSKLIARADRPFLLPQLDWEKKGLVPNVIFLEGALVNGLTHGLAATAYYGAADHVVGAATLRITRP
jgi:predicted GH43/DUF377 family glycosyl hydrolase